MTICSLDVLISWFETSLLFPVSSNCCFLTCIQISQEPGKVVWYSHLFKNFPKFIVIHTAKGFSVVHEARWMFFWNSLAFSVIQRMLAVWSLFPLPFLNPAWTSRSSRFIYCWSLSWRILSITLLVCAAAAAAKSLQSCPTLRSHGLQYARPPCPSSTPGVYSNSCPLSWWCHPTISSSVVTFSSRLQSLPASGSFPMSQFFTSGGQNIGALRI